MAICPICGASSAGKRITFNGFDVYDLCIKCASYSVCLISPNVDAPVKENAIRWADREIQNNADKMYLANCIRSWKQCAENQIRLSAPAPAPVAEPVKEVIDIDSTEIDLDATINSFNKGNYSAVMYEENKNTIDSSVLDMKKGDFFKEDSLQPAPAYTPEPAPAPAPAPFSAPAAFAAPAPFSAPYSPRFDEADIKFAPVKEEEKPEALQPVAIQIESTRTFEPVFSSEPAFAATEDFTDEALPPLEEAYDEVSENNFPEIADDAIEEEEEVYEEPAFVEEEKAEADEEEIVETTEEPLFGEYTPMTDEEIDEAARESYEEASKNFIDEGPDIKDYLREIALTLRSINERMERIEKEIKEMK